MPTNKKMTPEELVTYNASQCHNNEMSTAIIEEPTNAPNNITYAKDTNENSNDRLSAMEARLSSMHEMVARVINGQQIGVNTQPTTRNQSMALQNETPPFQNPIEVNVGLAGKSKTHYRISSPDTKELLTVPIELLDDCDDILTVTGQRKRKC